MNPLSPRSLRVRIALLVLLAVVPALILMATAAADQRRLAQKDAEDNALRLARLAAANQKQLVEGARQFLSAIAWTPAVRQRDTESCNALFRELLKGHSQYSNILAIKANGDLFGTGMEFRGTINLKDNIIFKRTVESHSFSIGEYKIGAVTGNAFVSFGYPVYDSGDDLLSVLVVAMDLDWLNQVAARAQIPEKMFVGVLDQNGVFLARHPFPEVWIGQQLPDPGLFAKMKAVQEGTAESTDNSGNHRLYGFTPLATSKITGGYVMIGVPSDLAFAEANRVFSRNMTVLAFVGFVAMIMAWWGGHIFIMRKVNALVKATHRVEAGDMAARSGVPAGRDELNQLAASFDQMAAALQARVEERKRAEDAFAYVASIVASSDDAIVGFTMDGSITTWNSAAGTLYGYGELEARGRHIKLLTPFARMDELPRIMDRLGRGERMEHFETVRVRKDGREVQVSVTYSPIKETSGKIVGVSSSARDITESKKAEEAVRRSREKYEALVNAVEGIVWEADPETFQFTFVSRQAEKILGYTIVQMLTTPGFLKEHLHPEDKDIVIGFWEMAVQQNRPQTVEFRLQAADGKMIWFRDHLSVVMEFDEPASLRGVMMDITRLRETATKIYRRED